MLSHCAFVIDSEKKTVFYTFTTTEVVVEEILRPYYNFLRAAVNKYGDAIIHVVDALEALVDETFPDLQKTDCIPAGTYYTFVFKTQYSRIHTHRNNYNDPDIKDINYFWPAKLIMLTKI